jgi:hypothetical protein
MKKEDQRRRMNDVMARELETRLTSYKVQAPPSLNSKFNTSFTLSFHIIYREMSRLTTLLAASVFLCISYFRFGGSKIRRNGRPLR